jgi:hypothetical protein
MKPGSLSKLEFFFAATGARSFGIPGHAQQALTGSASESEMTINEYMASGYACPHCGAPFNQGCRNHYPFHSATSEVSETQS